MSDDADRGFFIDATMSLELAEEPALVRAVRGHEALSQPYHYSVDAYVNGLDVANAPSSAAYVRLHDAGGRERHIHGAIEHLRVLSGAPGHVRCRFELRPPQYLLRWRRGFRIFQEKTVREIVTQVFQSAGLADDL